MKSWIFLFGLMLTGVGHSFAQPNIQNYLTMIEGGRGDDVRAELPALLRQYPNDSGVFYLQALLTTDGAEAVRLYQEIVDKYPKSEWADDALFKVYKFYSSIGLNRTADMKLAQLKANYPDSKYLAAAGEPDTSAHAGETAQQAQPPVQTPVQVPPRETAKNIATPKAVEPQKTIETPPAGNFTLQVGVYSTRANANKQREFFQFQKYPAEVASKIKGEKELFAVYVGRYATEDEARAKGDEIKQAFNINYLVVTR